MPSKTSESRGLRLPTALWERIDQEAAVDGVRPTEYVRGLVVSAFSLVESVRKNRKADLNVNSDDLASLFEE